MRTFRLPPIIPDLVVARNRLRKNYKSAALTFTLDGKLIGDIGEAVAAELLCLKPSARAARVSTVLLQTAAPFRSRRWGRKGDSLSRMSYEGPTI